MANHGDDDGEGGVWGVKGDLDELRGVDEGVDMLQSVGAFLYVLVWGYEEAASKKHSVGF